MPDPGPCALLGRLPNAKILSDYEEDDAALEWNKGSGRFTPYKNNWGVLWSPRYKTIITCRLPRRKIKGNPEKSSANVIQVFKGRPAKEFFYMDLYAGPLKYYGPAKHICYTSNKWYDGKKFVDYIHKLGKGVKVYGDKNKSFFICRGGRLHLNERGLIN